MSLIQPGFFQVLQRFQHRQDDLRRMYRTSDSFQSICHNYGKCSEALDYWFDSEHEESPNRQREYTALLRELELEIIQSLREGG